MSKITRVLLRLQREEAIRALNDDKFRAYHYKLGIPGGMGYELIRRLYRPILSDEQIKLAQSKRWVKS